MIAALCWTQWFILRRTDTDTDTDMGKRVIEWVAMTLHWNVFTAQLLWPHLLHIPLLLFSKNLLEFSSPFSRWFITLIFQNVEFALTKIHYAYLCDLFHKGVALNNNGFHINVIFALLLIWMSYMNVCFIDDVVISIQCVTSPGFRHEEDDEDEYMSMSELSKNSCHLLPTINWPFHLWKCKQLEEGLLYIRVLSCSLDLFLCPCVFFECNPMYSRLGWHITYTCHV